MIRFFAHKDGDGRPCLKVKHPDRPLTEKDLDDIATMLNSLCGFIADVVVVDGDGDFDDDEDQAAFHVS